RVAESFAAFRQQFAPVLGRKQWRERSQEYLRGLLVQAEERCNAENISEAIGCSARVMQRFLTEAGWDDTAVMERLQSVASPRLSHPGAIWAVDESGIPKQGKKSAGVARQYCGALGKVGNCQIGVFLAYLSPRGRLLVDKRLYLPQDWCNDCQRCEEAGIPAERRVYRSKPMLALEMMEQAIRWRHLQAQWVTGDDAYGQCPAFRDGVRILGLKFVLDVPSTTPVWPLEPIMEQPVSSGKGRPKEPQPLEGQRKEIRERAASLPEEAWQRITVAEGEQGPRIYCFACERLRETRDGEPGEEVWSLYRKALDGSEPRYYFCHAPVETSLEEMAQVSAARWPIETEFEDAKSLIGMDEYEVRSWGGWHHHIACCLLANAFLLSLEQEWEKKGPRDHPAAGVPDRARTATQGALLSRRPAEMVGIHPAA
ncbi:MAG TPA: IS701 family transposase, partial [Armatimonadota bacterium]|nr:IS701 family transposase [Armatimonadota bacterium]